MPGSLTIVFAVVGIVLAGRDARRLLPGVLLTLALTSPVAWLVGYLLDVSAVLAGLDQQTQDLIGGLLLLTVPLATGVVLGVALVVNGVTMLRRERRSPANALSLMAGLMVLGLLALGVLSVVAGWATLAIVLLFSLAPISYLGTALVAYLGWSLVYARIARRAPAPAAIVVLGSGLRNGRVPPLLAQRVALGVDTLTAHPGAVLVLSGGQGADEPRSEGDAMAEHALELGAPPDRVLVERASTTTEENLTLSTALLAGRGVDGPMLVTTSDYHAFRAATLLRRLGIAGHAVGARTAGYYRPSALLREFAAILRDHLVLNVIALAVLMLPVVAFIVVSLIHIANGG